MTTVPRDRLNFGLIVSKCEQNFNAPFVSNFAPPLVDKFYRNTQTHKHIRTNFKIISIALPLSSRVGPHKLREKLQKLSV